MPTGIQTYRRMQNTPSMLTICVLFPSLLLSVTLPFARLRFRCSSQTLHLYLLRAFALFRFKFMPFSIHLYKSTMRIYGQGHYPVGRSGNGSSEVKYGCCRASDAVGRTSGLKDSNLKAKSRACSGKTLSISNEHGYDIPIEFLMEHFRFRRLRLQKLPPR